MPSEPAAAVAWLEMAIREIERASVEEAQEIADKFTVQNLVTKTYTLNVATATTADIAAVLGTFLEDMKRRGPSRAE